MEKTAYKEIFEKSIYEIFFENAIKYLKPGYPAPWLSRYDSWAYITAFNPGSKMLREEENIRRNKKLLQDIKEMNYKYYEGQSYEPQSGYWHENGYLILNIDFETAKMLAAKYGQLAFLFGETGTPCRLIFL